jgi:hypothetical protein
MKPTKRILLWSLGLATGWFLFMPLHVSGADLSSEVKANATKYQTPEDFILDAIPFLGEIPRTFLLGDGYKMKLTPQELRIDHMGYRSNSPAAKRNCLIGFSYTTPVAGFFTTRVDLPLFSSLSPKMSDWTRSSFGDYVVYMSKGAAERTSLRLVVSAKF